MVYSFMIQRFVYIKLIVKVPSRFELKTSCLLDRRFNQRSHGTMLFLSVCLCDKLTLSPVNTNYLYNLRLLARYPCAISHLFVDLSLITGYLPTYSYIQARNYIEANEAIASPKFAWRLFVKIIYIKAVGLLPAHLTRLIHLFLSEIYLWGGGPRVVVSTAAFHARVRGSVPGLGGLKETKMFLPHPRVKVSIVGSLRER